MVTILLIVLAFILNHWWPVAVAVAVHLIAAWCRA